MIRLISTQDAPWGVPIVLEVITDPVEIAKEREQSVAFHRNDSWLREHYAEVIPDARGRYLAVAGREAFIADTSSEAIALATSAHPDDQGMIIRYISPHRGPKIYANRG